jgi:hypothetical protein
LQLSCVTTLEQTKQIECTHSPRQSHGVVIPTVLSQFDK